MLVVLVLVLELELVVLELVVLVELDATVELAPSVLGTADAVVDVMPETDVALVLSTVWELLHPPADASTATSPKVVTCRRLMRTGPRGRSRRSRRTAAAQPARRAS